MTKRGGGSTPTVSLTTSLMQSVKIKMLRRKMMQIMIMNNDDDANDKVKPER